MRAFAAALEAFARGPVADLPQRLQYQSTYPSHVLASALTDPGMGPGSRSASRREMARRWLQTYGFPADAAELDGRLQAILDRAREWETIARHDDPEVDAPPGRPFSMPVCEAHNDLCDEAELLADYCRQLSWTLKAKIAAQRGRGEVNGLSDRAAARLYHDLTGAKNGHKWIAGLKRNHDPRLPLEDGRITERSVAILAREMLKARPRKVAPKTLVGKCTCPTCGSATHKLIGADKVCARCFNARILPE